MSTLQPSLEFGNPRPLVVWAFVTQALDGDTLQVTDGISTRRVRLIGVNALDGKDGPCKQELERLVLGGWVQLEADDSQGRTDLYGRILAYVWSGNLLVNDWLIRRGYAYEATFAAPYRYHSSFQLAELFARLFGLGVWRSGS